MMDADDPILDSPTTSSDSASQSREREPRAKPKPAPATISDLAPSKEIIDALEQLEDSYPKPAD